MNLVKLTFNRINQDNLKIEVYRVLQSDMNDFDDFYSLTEKEREPYHFVTIDQDSYFEANINQTNIILYDLDKYTYDNVIQYEREAVGIQYYSFLSEDALYKKPVVSLYDDNFVFESYYNQAYGENNNIDVKYYVVIKKAFMRSSEPESYEETIELSGFDCNVEGMELTYGIPSILRLTINRAKENNRLVKYKDKYYYILPALNITGSNILNLINRYCENIGGTLMIINNWQELAIANYLSLMFTRNNGAKKGWVYVKFGISTYNPTNTSSFSIQDIPMSSIDLDDFKKAKLTEMSADKTNKNAFLIAANVPNNASIGYCDKNINLPFIIEFPSSEFENRSNALLEELYNNSDLIKFGNYSADGMPGADFCVLPENIKKREYQYRQGHLIGNYNRHCLLCFLTQQKFVGYNHSATFSSPASSHEVDDDCIVMVVSAVDSNEIYKYDTLSFIIKLNNNQTHCGVPANVQCALVYNVFLNNQIILKQDLTFNTRSNWNNFSHGMAIRAVKTSETIKLYRTGMRNSNNQLEKIDPEKSDPVITMSFSEIESITGIDFREGYLGYGNISQAETWIKNIDIVAEDADLMNDLKSKSMEYTAAIVTKDVKLNPNDQNNYYSFAGQELVYYDDQRYMTTANGLYNSTTIDRSSTAEYRVNSKITSDNYKHDYQYYYGLFSTPARLLMKNNRVYGALNAFDYPYSSIGTFEKACLFNKLGAIYNDKIISDWSLFDQNSSVKDSIKFVTVGNRRFISIPNMFKKEIHDMYKTFTYDTRLYNINFDIINDEYCDPKESMTFSMNRYQKYVANIDVIILYFDLLKKDEEDPETFQSDSRTIYLMRTTNISSPYMSKFNVPYSNEIDIDHLNRKYITFGSGNVFYYENFNDDNILIEVGNRYIPVSEGTNHWEEGEQYKTGTYMKATFVGYKHFSSPKVIGRGEQTFPVGNNYETKWVPKFHRYMNVLSVPNLRYFADSYVLEGTNVDIVTETNTEIVHDALIPLGISYEFKTRE